MALKPDYMKLRRLLQQRQRRLKKSGYTPTIKIPKIPKKITQGSIRRLTKIISKTPTVRQINKKLGLTPTGKLKKSTKNKIRKKLGLEPLPKKKTTKKKSTKHQDKYLPNETNVVIDNVIGSLSIDNIEDLITNMHISSKRGNTTHVSNMNELQVILRTNFDNAIFENGMDEITKRLNSHVDEVNRAIETIEGYYKDSDEESLREAIDAIEELISIIKGDAITFKEASELEEAYTRTTNFYNDNDEPVYKDLGNNIMVHYQENNLIVDPETGEVIEKFII